MADPLILGRYRQLETLGRGGSGTVELCWDTRIQRRVAIKRLPVADADGKQVPGLREARTAAMLSHPSIVSVYDFELDGAEALLIMEAVEGPSLARLIKDTPAGTFDLDILTSIATGVANALDFAHENQVLHLDVKPDNILVTRNGTTKVSDFGIAELAGSAGFGEASGGTIGYMPPEQMQGLPLDERCDEFAFAVVIYEMLTGRCPFAKKTLDASLKAIEKGKISAPSEFRDDIDPRIDDILLAALSPEREMRYASVFDFFDALLPHLGNASDGIVKLHEVIECEDDPDELPGQAEPHVRGGLRLTPAQRVMVGRIASAGLSWWTAFAALNTVAALGSPVAAAVSAASALGSLIKPAFGAVIALCMVTASLIACLQPMPILLATLLAACSILWLLAQGRDHLVSSRAVTDIACTFVAAPLSFAFCTPLASFAAAALMGPRRAAASAALSATTAFCIGTFWAKRPFLGFELENGDILGQALAAPAFWILLAGWVLATLSMSLLCSRGSRLLSASGSVINAFLLLASQMLAHWAMFGDWTAPAAPVTAVVVLAMMLTIVGTFSSLPNRYEGDR